MSLAAAIRARTLVQPRDERAPARNRPGLALRAGLAVLAGCAAVAMLAPLLAPYDPTAYSGRPLEYPSPAHWLGTNDVGQDIFSELIYGARVSLAVSGIAATISLGLAGLGGISAGYFGGWPAVVVMRLADLLLAVPSLPLMIVLAAYLPPSVGTTILVISVLAWPVPARTIRVQTLSLRSAEYVLAARLGGASSLRIGRDHLLPALSPLLTAIFVAMAGRALALEAGLALLGLGDPLARSWGAIMRAALSYGGIFLTPHWTWWLLPPAAAVSLLVLALTLVGIGLETRLDPRLGDAAARRA